MEALSRRPYLGIRCRQISSYRIGFIRPQEFKKLRDSWYQWYCRCCSACSWVGTRPRNFKLTWNEKACRACWHGSCRRAYFCRQVLAYVRYRAVPRLSKIFPGPCVRIGGGLMSSTMPVSTVTKANASSIVFDPIARCSITVALFYSSSHINGAVFCAVWNKVRTQRRF